MLGASLSAQHVGEMSFKFMLPMHWGSTLVCDAAPGPPHCQVEDSCRPVHVWPSRAQLKGQRIFCIFLSLTGTGTQSLHGQSHAPGQGDVSYQAEFPMQAQDGPVMSGSTSPLSMSSHALSPLSSSPRLSSGVQPRLSFQRAASNRLP